MLVKRSLLRLPEEGVIAAANLSHCLSYTIALTLNFIDQPLLLFVPQLTKNWGRGVCEPQHGERRRAGGGRPKVPGSLSSISNSK